VPLGGGGHYRGESVATDRGGGQEEDEYHLLHGTEGEQGFHPGRRWDVEHGGADERYDVPPYEEDSSYRGAGHQPASALGHEGYQQSSAISPGYDEFRPRQ
jgi:hypothetical protein